MSEWVQKVVSKWVAEGVRVNDGASLAYIEAIETTLDFKFPHDFKEFYLTINGFEKWDWQEHMFTFYSLDTIVEEFDAINYKDFIGFSDFLLASHRIGFRKGKIGIYKIYPSVNHEDFSPIAQTFEEVIGLINSSSDLIY